MHEPQQTLLLRRLEYTIIAFFLLIAVSVLVIYAAVPSIYTQTLKLESPATHPYPLPATLFLVALLVFIAVLIVGVKRHWRWLFWLLFVAFGFSILQVPATILQLTGILPDDYPVWYSLYRMCIALVEFGIAIWMIAIYRRYGVWAMGKKENIRREHV